MACFSNSTVRPEAEGGCTRGTWTFTIQVNMIDQETTTRLTVTTALEKIDGRRPTLNLDRKGLPTVGAKRKNFCPQGEHDRKYGLCFSNPTGSYRPHDTKTTAHKN